jgi:hypothetical protein
LTPDQAARLDKYFLQILAGVTNANVVLDPHGNLTLGAVHRIPFTVSETDFGLDVFLLCQWPYYVDFELEAPDGSMLTPAVSGVLTNAVYVQTSHLAYYRLSLPAIPADAGGTHTGSWNAVLRIASKRGPDSREFASAAVLSGVSIPYDLVVHCYSNLLFEAHAHQTSFEPGATVTITATLREYDVPVENRAKAWAQVNRPDGSTFTMQLVETEAGRYEQSFVAFLSGLYTMRVRAIGETSYGSPFAREQTLTAAVYPGGDHVEPGDGGAQSWCELLDCLLSEGVLGPRLRKVLLELGLDVNAFIRCVEKYCRAVTPLREGRIAPTALPKSDELRTIVERVVRELEGSS